MVVSIADYSDGYDWENQCHLLEHYRGRVLQGR